MGLERKSFMRELVLREFWRDKFRETVQRTHVWSNTKMFAHVPKLTTLVKTYGTLKHNPAVCGPQAYLLSFQIVPYKTLGGCWWTSNRGKTKRNEIINTDTSTFKGNYDLCHWVKCLRSPSPIQVRSWALNTIDLKIEIFGRSVLHKEI